MIRKSEKYFTDGEFEVPKNNTIVILVLVKILCLEIYNINQIIKGTLNCKWSPWGKICKIGLQREHGTILLQ